MPFDFFEVVRVEPGPEAPSEIQSLRGRIGAVLGTSAEEGQDPTSYAVALDGIDEVWSFNARDLHATGQFRKREEYYDGASIRVSLDGEVRPVAGRSGAGTGGTESTLGHRA